MTRITNLFDYYKEQVNQPKSSVAKSSNKISDSVKSRKRRTKSKKECAPVKDLKRKKSRVTKKSINKKPVNKQRTVKKDLPAKKAVKHKNKKSKKSEKKLNFDFLENVN